jgi:hypothetical protein
MEYKNKLVRINEIISEKRNKQDQIKSNYQNHSFLNLNSSNKKLLKQNLALLESNQTSDDIPTNTILKYNVTKKKLNILKVYINIAWGVILLRYIDILVKVKHGGY